MKKKLGVKDNRPLADFLPTLTIAAKNLATEMTNYNVEEKDLQGEVSITVEHIQNNSTVREMLGQRGIRPEDLPASEDIKKLERRVKSQEKKIATQWVNSRSMTRLAVFNGWLRFQRYHPQATIWCVLAASWRSLRI